MLKLIRKPTVQELETINKFFAPEPVKEDDVYIFDVEAANSGQMTAYFSFLGEDMIQGFHDDVMARHTNENAEKVGFLFGHNDNMIPSGLLFKSEVAEQPIADALTIKHFRPTVSMRKNLNVSGINTDDYAKAVNAGQTEAVSVGFQAGSYLCDICGNDVRSWDCAHIPGRWYNTAPEGETPVMKLATYTVHQGAVKKRNLIELSAVYAAGLPGARIRGDLSIPDSTNLSIKDGKLVNGNDVCIMSTNIKDFKPTDILRFNLRFDGSIERVCEVVGEGEMTIKELQDALNAMTAEKNTLQAQVDGIKVSLEEVKGQLQTAQTTLAQKENEAKTLTGILGQSEHDKADLQIKLADAEGQITQLQADLEAQKKVAEKYVTSLKDQCRKLSVAINGAAHNDELFDKEIAALSVDDLVKKSDLMQIQLAQMIPVGRKTQQAGGLVDRGHDLPEDNQPVDPALYKFGK